MSEEQLNHELLKRYVLGDLSESEAEAVEARYFTDLDFLCELLATRNDLLDAAFRNELLPSESGQLSIQLQMLPALRQNAAFAHDLQQILSQPIAIEVVEQTATPPIDPLNLEATSSLAQLKHRLALPRWSWVLVALVLLFAAWFWPNLIGLWHKAVSPKITALPASPTPAIWPGKDEKPTTDVPTVATSPASVSKTSLPTFKSPASGAKQAAAVATFVLSAGLVREGQSAPELEVAASIKMITLQLELAPPLNRPHQALLRDSTGVVVWQQKITQWQTYHEIRLAICEVPTSNLSEGVFQLHLVQPDGANAIYYFRLKWL